MSTIVTGRLPRFVQTYVEQIRARCAYMLDDAKPRPIVAEVLNTPPNRMSWSDLAVLQNAIIDLQGVDDLRRQVWLLREEVKSSVPPEVYADYIASGPPVLNDASEDALRGDARELVAWLNATYALQFEQSKVHGDIYIGMSFFLAVLVVALMLVTVGVHWLPLPSNANLTLIVVMISGAAGAIVSTQQRLGSTSATTITRLMTLEVGRYSSFLTPVTGPVFATILFMLFVGGLVNGQLFPAIDVPSGGNWMTFLLGAVPHSGADLAKLAIWSFIAGFFERFVPDTLQRLAGTATSTAVKIAPAATPAPSASAPVMISSPSTSITAS